MLKYEKLKQFDISCHYIYGWNQKASCVGILKNTAKQQNLGLKDPACTQWHKQQHFNNVCKLVY